MSTPPRPTSTRALARRADRKRLAEMLRHARAMMAHMETQLDEVEAAYRDEEEASLDDALDQMVCLVLELGNDARNVLYCARGWDLSPTTTTATDSDNRRAG